ncbi:preprotein translocase subunit SecE, partial [Dysosmobacter welbionis]
DLAVGPALDPAFQAERVPHLEPGRLDRQLSPGDHRQIVRPAVPAAHRQHQVADAAAQRGAAEDGGLAQDAG